MAAADAVDGAPSALRWLPRPSARHLVVVLVAIAAGLANIWVLQGVDRPVEVATVTVDVPAGGPIDADVLAPSTVEATPDLLDRLVPAAEIEAVAGRVASRPIAAGEPLLRSDLVDPVGAGMRTMSLPVTRDVAVAGSLVVGDRVDVVWVSDAGAEFLATGLSVVAVPVDEGLGATAFAPTVAVDADTALALAAALETGGVHLLRSTGANGG